MPWTYPKDGSARQWISEQDATALAEARLDVVVDVLKELRDGGWLPCRKVLTPNAHDMSPCGVCAPCRAVDLADTYE